MCLCLHPYTGTASKQPVNSGEPVRSLNDDPSGMKEYTPERPVEHFRDAFSSQQSQITDHLVDACGLTYVSVRNCDLDRFSAK